jgi:hypothetical protein
MSKSETKSNNESTSSNSSKKSSRLRSKFNDAKKLDSAVDLVKASTADQKLPNGPSPPVKMGAPPTVNGFSETFVTSIFSQAIVKMDEAEEVFGVKEFENPTELSKNNCKK